MPRDVPTGAAHIDAGAAGRGGRRPSVRAYLRVRVCVCVVCVCTCVRVRVRGLVLLYLRPALRRIERVEMVSLTAYSSKGPRIRECECVCVHEQAGLAGIFELTRLAPSPPTHTHTARLDHVRCLVWRTHPHPVCVCVRLCVSTFVCVPVCMPLCVYVPSVYVPSCVCVHYMCE